MFKTILVACLLALFISTSAKTILVKDINELNTANTQAKSGDIIVLQNGEWKNVTIQLDCIGTKEKPIIFKAETYGKVLITGNSKLAIGGQFITVDGLLFIDGYAGEDAAITFRTNKKQIAYNCRVTNIAINDYNNPKRLDENYWVAFYGKNNRLDHSSFLNKKNIGVLLAIILDDERSRENFHSIDHNYFGVRLPLASNGGEIIRVGVSQHAKYNSFTQITDNYFEHCDGETEIISIKSCSNIIRNNVFRECQGAVVLRHGNLNTVENNIFFGNNKEGTGGVRIINAGQYIVNNFFYKCKGEGFRSALSIMNGIPNSPENRYNQVLNAIVSNNTFHECGNINFCEGSDIERTAIPKNVQFVNNLFYNKKDSIIFKANDNIEGIYFNGNLVSKSIKQELPNGYIKDNISLQKLDNIGFPISGNTYIISDSIKKAFALRGVLHFSNTAGYSNLSNFKNTYAMVPFTSGARWYKIKNTIITNSYKIDCENAEEVIAALNKNSTTAINLISNEYIFSTPITISNNVIISTAKKTAIKFSSSIPEMGCLIKIKAGCNLSFTNIHFDLASLNTHTFLSTDTSANSNHSNFTMSNCSITSYNGLFFKAAKSSVCDSIIVNNCAFNNNKGTIFYLNEETDRKGYYNVEKIKLTNNTISNNKGQLVTLLRSGNDESTMGPKFIFINNKITNCFTENGEALISNNGVQYSHTENNEFMNCNTGKILIRFEDIVRAKHIFIKNKVENSGEIQTNKFTEMSNNTIQ
jgi:poly(beta-D-mannuronate) lyase